MAWQDRARSLGLALSEAYNNKNKGRVDALLKEASAAAAAVPFGDRQEFWKAVLRTFRSQPLLMEKQANSSLHDLLKAIEDALQEGQNGK